MFFGNVEKLETTTDKDVANTLLKKGWVLVDVITNHRREFVFLLAACDENRIGTNGVTGKSIHLCRS